MACMQFIRVKTGFKDQGGRADMEGTASSSTHKSSEIRMLEMGAIQNPRTGMS